MEEILRRIIHIDKEISVFEDQMKEELVIEKENMKKKIEEELRVYKEELEAQAEEERKKLVDEGIEIVKKINEDLEAVIENIESNFKREGDIFVEGLVKSMVEEIRAYGEG